MGAGAGAAAASGAASVGAGTLLSKLMGGGGKGKLSKQLMAQMLREGGLNEDLLENRLRLLQELEGVFKSELSPPNIFQLQGRGASSSPEFLAEALVGAAKNKRVSGLMSLLTGSNPAGDSSRAAAIAEQRRQFDALGSERAGDALARIIQDILEKAAANKIDTGNVK